MHTFKLTIAYDGTRYSGWQVQPNALSIQELIQNAFKMILHQEEVSVIGSGRTDAGVHAAGQVAHLRIPAQPDLFKMLGSLNGILPQDIRIKKIEEVPNTFHAQYGATGKEYHYYLFLDPVMDPIKRLYSWHVHRPLDLDKMGEAALQFLGTHDFTSFANEAHSGAASRDPVRTLYRLQLVDFEGGVKLEFQGDGFLYKMVRNIVGTLVDVSSGRKKMEEINRMFEGKDRRLVSFAAPPQGLFLYRVDYDPVRAL